MGSYVSAQGSYVPNSWLGHAGSFPPFQVLEVVDGQRLDARKVRREFLPIVVVQGHCGLHPELVVTARMWRWRTKLVAGPGLPAGLSVHLILLSLRCVLPQSLVGQAA